ncbi:hypothetical protein [Hydromonas duriensis]|nr:hypothetical protein [Hydromonas duriensis]
MAVYQKPVAKLYYVSFKADGKTNFALSFYSDIDLPNLFTRRESSGRLLACPLEQGKKIFPEEGYVMSAIFDNIEPNYSFDNNKNLYFYSESVRFVDTDNAWAEVGKDKVRALLKNQKTVKCKVIAPIYLGGHYESEVMEIPVSDILNTLDSPM